MRPKRSVRAALAAPIESLGTLLSSHRAVTRVLLAALSLTLVIALSQQAPATQAGPQATPLIPESLLPQNIGVAVPTDASVSIAFDASMNPGSVEAALQVLPQQPVSLSWSAELDRLTVRPERLWRTDESYLVVVGDGALRTDGEAIGATRRYTFSTQTAPSVSDFQVSLAGVDLAAPKIDADASAKALAVRDADALTVTGDEGDTNTPMTTATQVSATSAITVSFSAAMDEADVERAFAITPEVPGDINWKDGKLVFTPSERLEPGARYTISVIGAHDRTGNVLGGEGNFSFVVQPGAQLTKTRPKGNESDVEPSSVELWFSQPMDVDATNKAFAMTDTATGALVGGHLTWNTDGTQLTYVPDNPFAGGRTFEVSFDGGARDADGNTVAASLSFTTKAAPVVTRAATSTRTSPTVSVPPPAPASSMAGYAVNQINAARAAYGFGPVALDASISAVAYAHAYDQAANNYLSHTGRDGSTRESRLRAGGISFGWSGENQCMLVGRSVQGTLDWCHAQFMSEPYPGHWNHIANILNPNARRVGVGIAQVGSRIVIVWDYTD